MQQRGCVITGFLFHENVSNRDNVSVIFISIKGSGTQIGMASGVTAASKESLWYIKS